MSGLQSQGVTVPTGQQLRFKKSGVKVQPNPNTAALRPQEPGLLKDHNLRFAFARWNPTMLTAFRLILLVRFCSAMYTSISDCDEGEPTLLLSLSTRSELTKEKKHRSLQLLGSSALPRTWERVSNLGIFTRILNSILFLPPHSRWTFLHSQTIKV